MNAATHDAHERGGPGYRITHLTSFSQFERFIREEMLDFRHFVWRGHASDKWQLLSTLDRDLLSRGQKPDRRVSAAHLQRFKMAARGRRGSNPPAIGDNDWWALGQHNGLVTPLLDWTRSPFVAAYFAYFPTQNDGAERRAVFGLSSAWVKGASSRLAKTSKDPGDAPIVEFVEPLSDDNPRLVNQSGLFTRGPEGVALEEWVKTHDTSGEKKVRLWKVTMPNSDRDIALRTLNRMNINHLSLFPDLFGAAKFVNTDLRVEKY